MHFIELRINRIKLRKCKMTQIEFFGNCFKCQHNSAHISDPSFNASDNLWQKPYKRKGRKFRCHHWYLPFSCAIFFIQAANLVYGRPGCESHIWQRGSLSMSQWFGLVRDLDLKITVTNKQWLINLWMQLNTFTFTGIQPFS